MSTHAVPTGTSGIRLASLTKSFGTVRAVNGIDLSIDAGETVALLGPNGAGKSTTIDMLLGLSRPDGGTVTVFGVPPSEAVRRGAVGAMLQNGQLIRDLKVRELVDMVASLYPDPLRVEDVMAQTDITGIADRRTQRLSGGETQRTRLALALVTNPELLVLDEPTVALDVDARRRFWTAMREFVADRRTVLFATHYLEEADAYADRIVVLAHGKVVADGPGNEIKAMVGLRTVRATLPQVDVATLSELPGVVSVERRGESVVLSCADSDVALRALLTRFADARDIEVRGAGLEEAFLELTGDGEDTHTADDRP